ncbi:MAG TPA: aldehyde ferredoxin oxidoreductase N-terminal domain-containing protein, partial [Anaerolineaceae bacterium]|nr:aldehyde ferredoxin oxidoreductase N-terminal domain-containing protein [Anaerolineaceae bacterium]
MRTILRVNTRTNEIKTEQASDALNRICGRQFLAHILNNEVEPTCEPLGRRNKFIITHGWFSDTNLSTAGKISIGGKSPLTGGIKEANSGGYFGRRLSRLGIKAVIFEDTPAKKDSTRILFINSSGATLIEAPELKHLLVMETITALRTKFGANIGILCIGPAGERLFHGAGVACPDDRDVQIRYAARGGLGALLGSKGIKAVVVQADKTVPAEVADPELLKATIKEVNTLLEIDPKSKNRRLYGTLDIMDVANHLGILPTRNFSEGYFE